jgi:DNA-binding transcriptional LysR family regulator
VERVRAGALDLAIVTPSRIPPQLAEQVAPISLGSDDLVVVEAAAAPFFHGKRVAIRDLAAVPFLRMSRRRAPAAALDPLLTREGLEPARIIMEVANWEGLKTAVRLGLGAAVVFRSVVLEELRRGDLRVVEVDDFAESIELALISSPQRRNERMTAAFRALLAHLEAQIPAAAGQT